ncbi:MAG: hypothetical protein A2X31_01040 [Elusimicrobia bacterium GWB2_63_22]|nr:MAG: hypothetical protein A2X31_01040 [Elusimicrobia bacterium GWB2_63_22]
MKKLYVFSYGLYPEQITLETLAAMRECGEVYSHCLDAATARQFLRYAPGLKLTAGLDRRATAEAAVRGLAAHDTVGFLTYGNPLFLNQTAAELMAGARRRGALVKVFSAVSSFDALVNLFNLNEYADGSLRVADTATLIYAPVFTPGTDTLFFVPDVLNLPANAALRKKFVSAAKKAYPPSAPAYLADCASISSRKATVLKGKISALPALLSKLNERHTLYIPAVRGR